MRATLTSKNDTAVHINNILLKSFQAKKIQYRPVDSTLPLDDAVQCSVKFLNSFDSPRYSPHMH